ncbi:MAG: YncE family protein [Bacteroidota bacterium]
MPQFKFIVYIVFFALFFSACRIDPLVIDLEASNYPKPVGKIILNKCATSGCHNDISKEAASGLSLSSWEKMFEGTRNGVTVIPFNHAQSTLFLYTNTYPELGISNKPVMPFNDSALTIDEVKLLQKWIDEGAPNAKGDFYFKDDANASRIYVTNQGCDLVTVFDAKTKLPMRYIKVGNSPDIESPHYIKVSPDGKYWYVVFTNGTALQKYRTIDNSFVAEANLGAGIWNTFTISNDGKKIFAVDWSANGKVFYIDTETMLVKRKYQGNGLFNYPHGCTLSKNDSVLYVTAQTGNFFYKIDVGNPMAPDFEDSEVVLDENTMPLSASILDIHEIVFTPDYSSYVVTCQKTNDVRFVNAKTNKVEAIVQTGIYPQELVFSTSNDYLFVSCPEDTLAFPGSRGCVSVINYKTKTLVKNIYTGSQPHGLAIDEKNKLVYVTNRNTTSDGPAPHHTTECGGRNGYVTTIDLNTLELVGKKIEVSVDPYSVAVKK